MVEIAGKSGEVEEVTLRYVRLRDVDGYVHYVPNGEIKLVTNRTRGFAHAVIDAVITEQPERRGCVPGDARGRRRAARRIRISAARILGDVEIVGIERWEHFGVMLRCRMKVLPREQWTACGASSCAA